MIRSVAFFSKSINKTDKNYKIHDKEMLAVIKILVLQTQVLRVEQVDKPYIRLIQENSIKNSVQECLSYILNNDDPCYYFSSLP